MIIGLTGGIASGKSTVSSFLSKLGAEIIDADKIAHNILQKGNPAYKKVVEEFGTDLLTKNGEINRSRLGTIVFNDFKKKKVLEEITHPFIIDEIYRKIEENRKKKENIVVDAPLLFETGLDKIVDQVWVIYVDKKIQLQRIIFRDKITKIEAKKRVQAQLSLEKKREMADYVFENNGNVEELKDKVIKKWREIDEDKKDCFDRT